MGFFKKQNIDVSVQTLPNGSVIGAAVAAGTFQIGFSNLTSIAEAIHSGLPFVMLAPAGIFYATAPTTLTYVMADSPIKSAKDLAGKTVAITGLKNAQEGSLRAWVDNDGGNGASLKIIDMPFPQMQDALVAGRVDAIFVAEPSLSRAQHSANLRLLGSPYTSIGKRFLIGAWFADSHWVQAHRADAIAFVKAMRETADWANTHPTESGPILAKYTGLPADAIKNMTRSKYALTLDPADMQPELDNAAKYGYLPPIAASSLFVTLDSVK